MKEASLSIQRILIDHGYFVSQKRQIIIDYMCGSPSIENIDEFWLRIRRDHAISWATVRNTIRLLMDLGCLVSQGKGIIVKGFDRHFSGDQKAI